MNHALYFFTPRKEHPHDAIAMVPIAFAPKSPNDSMQERLSQVVEVGGAGVE